MGFLDRAIKRGVSNAVGNAVERGVRQAVEPKLEQAAANAVNSAANQIIPPAPAPQPAAPRASVNQAQMNQAASALGGVFGGISAFANEAAKNMKICPVCGAGAGRDVKFCPGCGSPMPEGTVGDGAICSSCGMQNQIGTKFCAGCGAKLPCAVAEEQAAQARAEAVMRDWDVKLSAYPKWSFGGTEPDLEQSDGYVVFTVTLPDAYSAQNAVRQYRDVLMRSGFREAGQYPNSAHLYKLVNGSCLHCDTEHCFDGDINCPSIYFNCEEPSGGFNYVKPEPKKASGLMGFFK